MPSIQDKLFDKIIDETTEQAMAEDEIKKHLPNARIVKYSDLAKYKNLKQLFPKKHDYIILLYQNAPYEGHWVLVVKDDKDIEFFDPYGEPIDTQLNWISPEENYKLGITAPYLSNLIRGSGLRFRQNRIKYQNDKDSDMNTCGRHVITRMMFLAEKNHDLQDYEKIMKLLKKKLKVSYDEIVSGFVNRITEKL